MAKSKDNRAERQGAAGKAVDYTFVYFMLKITLQIMSYVFLGAFTGLIALAAKISSDQSKRVRRLLTGIALLGFAAGVVGAIFAVPALAASIISAGVGVDGIGVFGWITGVVVGLMMPFAGATIFGWTGVGVRYVSGASDKGKASRNTLEDDGFSSSDDEEAAPLRKRPAKAKPGPAARMQNARETFATVANIRFTSYELFV